MIGKVSGRLDYRGADHVLIDTGGVGYIVHCSERTLAAMPGPGEAVSLYTDLLVREDLMQLFGFRTLAEREWHRLLMTVQGVGAKAALAILGALGTEGLARALAVGDATAIRAAPGVGPKIAQRVVLELKTKAPGVMAMGSGGAAPAAGGRAAPACRRRGRRAGCGGGCAVGAGQPRLWPGRGSGGGGRGRGGGCARADPRGAAPPGAEGAEAMASPNLR